MTSRIRTANTLALALLGALSLGACAVPYQEPYDYGYPAYAPGYYVQPQSTFVFSYRDGPRRGPPPRYRRHHHQHWHH